MGLNLIIKQILRYLATFGDVSSKEREALEKSIKDVVVDSEECFSVYKGLPKTFNIYQTHHSIYFLFKLAQKLYVSGEGEISNKLYLINRLINGIDLYYKIEMPKYFVVGHGLGTVFSRASYGEYLVIFQNSTIGVSGGKYPTIGDKVVIFPNCVISGNTIIGENSVISAGSIIINKIIPPNSIVFGAEQGKLIFKDNYKKIINDYFDI